MASIAFALALAQLTDLSAFSVAYLDTSDPTAAAEVASWNNELLQRACSALGWMATGGLFLSMALMFGRGRKPGAADTER
ncbi:MAG: hypothetical protein AB7G40_10140 [Hyphomonadaceae bacterium]